ncbi:MAG: DUF262 domain-containing protein [Thermodesulfobacteriota bacterium]
MIERGELRLPEMQRQYIWRSTRVRDLLDSLYRGYPSGAILIWETTRSCRFATSHSRSRRAASRARGCCSTASSGSRRSPP